MKIIHIIKVECTTCHKEKYYQEITDSKRRTKQLVGNAMNSQCKHCKFPGINNAK
jgi:hypothetical protein